MTPEAERELHDLRRRAYGPEAGGGLDAGEAARLEELESHVRSLRVATRSGIGPLAAGQDAAQSTAGVRAEGPAPSMPSASARSPEHASSDAATFADETPLTNADAPEAASDRTLDPGARRPWWRSRAVWVGVAAGLVVGAVAATSLSAIRAPAPAGTLHPAADSSDAVVADQTGIASYLGVDAETLVRFDEWKSFAVSMGARPDGDRCLFVTAPQALLGFGCGFDGLDPQVDLWVHEGMATLIGDILPAGSFIRFVARGDTIDVWEQLGEPVSAQ